MVQVDNFTAEHYASFAWQKYRGEAFGSLSAIAELLVLSVAVVTSELPHNHAPDEASGHRGLLLKNMQSKVQRNPSMPVRRVYDKCANDLDNDDHTPGFANVRSRIKRVRSKFIHRFPEPSTT